MYVIGFGRLKYLCFLFICLIFFGNLENVYSASDSAQTVQEVSDVLGINKMSDLDFGSAMPGEPLKRVPPNNTEDPENASFLVTGTPRLTFNIILPTTSVFLASPGSTDLIEVNTFRSRPASSSRIRNTGEREIFVGATRRPIGASVKAGVYTGYFVVTIVY